jgi:single-strand DNA-binding protein
MSYCKLIIQGNVGNQPEWRFTSDGKEVANFSIAVSEKRGQTESTTWFRCAAFGKTAEVVNKYVEKGSNVLVDGRIASRKFTDKNGTERESWNVTVDHLQLLGSKPKEDTTKQDYAKASGGFDSLTDDIPF